MEKHTTQMLNMADLHNSEEGIFSRNFLIPRPAMETLNDQPDVPVLKYNYALIVGAVILSEDLTQVLLIQEAKKSCRGRWYLPAGRVEPNGETLPEAIQREVKEEAGVDFQPEHVYSLEIQSLQWYRAMFIGKITGGNLKTTDEEDSESLQAQYFSISELDKIPIRAKDIFPLIELAVSVYKNRSVITIPVLPKTKSYKFMYCTPIFTYQQNDTGDIFVLGRQTAQIPQLENIYLSLKSHCHVLLTITHRSQLLSDTDFSGSDDELRLAGLTDIDFSQQNNSHGFRYTVLLTCRRKYETKDNVVWTKLTGSLEEYVKLSLNNPISVCSINTH